MMNRCKKVAFACLLAAPLTMLPVKAATVGTPCPVLVSDQDAKTPKPLEPSGMVWDGKSTLYIVSDNGQIVSIPVADTWTTDPTLWTVLYQWTKTDDPVDKAANDFESVARVPGQDDFLYVGVEGDGGKDCEECAGSTIKEFSISGKKFTAKSWLLGGKNMEAMTFVPDATADPGGFKGYFLTAAQNSGKLHRYDLNLKDGKTVTEKTAPTFTPKIGSATADFQFSPGNSVFYVLYDADQESSLPQRLDQYTKSGDAFGSHVPTNLPYSRGTEAVADVLKDGKVDIYVGVDMSNKQRPTDKAPNRVDLYSPFPGNANCPCAAVTSCGQIKDTSCGWCASIHRGMPGTEKGGPSTSGASCANWIWKTSDCNCAAMTKCKDIGDGKKNCGWCKSTGVAMPGDKKGPSYGSCQDWIWSSDSKPCGN